MTSRVLFDELTIEILSWLPVKSLLRFMCVCKRFHSFISHPSFVKLHLQRSPKSTNFLLQYAYDSDMTCPFVLPFSVRALLENPLSFIDEDLILSLGFDLKNKYEVCGSCNGLVCLVDEVTTESMEADACKFYLWNPATRKTFENPQCVLALPETEDIVMFGFGYDNTSDTYKVVAVLTPISSSKNRSLRSLVCSISGDNCWRNIQHFPADPTKMVDDDGVYLKNTLNWLVSTPQPQRDHDYDDVTIVSLDLGNETFTQFLLPPRLDGVNIDDFLCIGESKADAPTIGVLNECLSLFVHDRKKNHFSIWQMKEFGNQRSWTRLLGIDTQKLRIDCTPRCDLLPLCVFENGRVLIIHNTYYHQLRAIFYDARDNTVQHFQIADDILWVYEKDYVQSLVSPTIY